MYALAQAYGMMAAGLAERALVVGGDVLSRILDWTDRSTLVLFGDGAGAVVLEKVEQPGFLGFELGRGRRRRDPPLAARQRLAAHRGSRPATGYVHMNGRGGLQVRHAGARLVCARTSSSAAASAVEDVDVYIPHQANVRIMDHAAQKLGIPRDRMVVNVDRYGNTSSGSIPLALADAQAGRAAQEGRPGVDDRHGSRPHVGLGSDGVDAVKPGLVAFCFPGQGSLEVGMGQRDRGRRPRGDGRSSSAQARRPASTCSGSASRRPEAELVETEVQQPALVATSLAVLRGDPRPRRSSRTSSSATRSASSPRWPAAGALKVEEAVALVRERGLAMAEAARTNPGSMAAILGLDDEVVERICRRILNVWPANYNCPGQIVVSGEDPAVDEACEAAEEEGARRAVKLRVSGAFHSPLVARAADRLRPALDRVKFAEPTAPFMSTVTARIETAKRMGPLLVEQLTAPVRFTHAAQALVREGVHTFVEVGPGTSSPALSSESTATRRRSRSRRPESLDKLEETLASA